MVLTFIIALASLIVLMIIHEFGHFIIAKKFGVRVEEFGIGYPPRLFGKKFGETLYSVNLVPLGAFVKIHGEEGVLPEARDVHDPRSFSNLSLWKRALIVLGGVLAFWVASIIIFTVVFAIGAVVPVGDQDIEGFTNPAVKIMVVQEGSPAAQAGLKSGDVLLQAKSMRYESAQAGPEVVVVGKISDFQDFVRRHGSEQLELSINRGGKVVNVTITPRTEYPQGQGPTGVVLERFATLIEKAPWYEAPFRGIWFCGQVTIKAIYGIVSMLANMVGGNGLPSGAELAGPVGITIFLARAADYGIGFFLYFIGSISVFIALFNLFPIPALDGGKLLFLAIEKFKGQAVSPKVEQHITVLFFVLLISMSLFITIRFDIPRLVDFWRIG